MTLFNVLGTCICNAHLQFLDPETGAAQSVELSAPSSNTYSDINPGVRLYYLDADTFDLLDYDQYFLFLGNEDGASPQTPLRDKMDTGRTKGLSFRTTVNK